MAVYNLHERVLPVGEKAVGALIDSLAGPADQLWPADRWPPMKFDRPLAVGAVGGHGPVRYTVATYIPGTWIRFTFTGPRGFHGFHEYTVHPLGQDRTVLRHTLAMAPRGSARLSWPLLFRPLHNACLQDSLDRAELTCTGTLPHPANWSPYTRFLRRLLRVPGGRGDTPMVGSVPGGRA